jgi:protease-4
MTESIQPKKSKKELWMWRIIAAIVIFSIFSQYSGNKKQDVKENCIVKTQIYGPISYDNEMLSRIEDLQKNKKVKGVLIQLNSPGGDVVGAEAVYKAIKNLKSEKPVVVSIQSLAASGGYMAAMAADHIVAYEGSILGSIGVVFQDFEVTDLAEKLGVKFLNYKSTPLKAMPNRFEKMNKEAEKNIEAVIDDTYAMFKEMVRDSRKNIKEENFSKICDGSIYTGRQALQNGLIDSIGGEKEAVEVLKKQYKVDESVSVIDFDLISHKDSRFSWIDNIKHVINITSNLHSIVAK